MHDFAVPKKNYENLQILIFHNKLIMKWYINYFIIIPLIGDKFT